MTPLLLLLALQSPNLKAQGIAAREAGQLAESTRLLTRQTRLTPNDPESWWYLGLNAYDQDQHAPCATAFQKVFQLDPKNGGAAAFLGLCEFHLGQHKNAFAHLVLARQAGLLPGSELEKVAHHHYLMLLNQLGQFELAASALATAARSTPDLPFLETMCGLAALRIAQLPMSVPPAQREPVALAGRASLLAFQRRTTEARQIAATLAEKYPTLPNVHYLLGYLALLDQDPASISLFTKELTISPDHVQARLQIAYEHLKRGDSAAGLPFAAAAARLAPGDFTARNIHGRLLLALDQPATALPELEAAVKLAPNSPEAHFHLASAYSRLNRKQDAQRHRDIFARLEKERQQ